MYGTLSGDIAGDFTVTYSANIQSLQTQAGTLEGTMTAGVYRLKVTGEIEPLVFAGLVEVAPGIFAPTFQLTIHGLWTFT